MDEYASHQDNLCDDGRIGRRDQKVGVLFGQEVESGGHHTVREGLEDRGKFLRCQLNS